MSKEKKPKQYTNAQIEKIKNKSYWDGLTMFIVTAMDEFDWTEDELLQFLERLKRYDSAVHKDKLLSMDDLREIIFEVMGVRLEGKR